MKEIIIKKIENRQNDFVAYFKNPILKATYTLCFTDSLTGSIALNDFFQMLKSKYIKDQFEFIISDKTLKFKNEYLLKEFINNREAIQ